MNIKQEKDTYGSKLRNLLSPFYNIVVLTQMDNEEKILNFLFSNKDVLLESYKKMLDLSYSEDLDKIEYKEY
jgi:hypothetical protein